ncbi:DUF397 domain-containing protein [Streptomyces europaeiscabiei]|uniref:DUF397 domain-containing protein n=1 Tax=Streptomyces europaeiscabiei TaxID=146819 RepID=UPI0029A05276|nr:DUF397 domain-containing protein [Streptomyces europaeiscabiei]MDX3864818.1 DUF397 domain-containing protein [Streptomyces europaeiscabiei]MDX3871002.1 DUF397 domain-containing protein [Streptomyces europaeiscabiei]
MKAKVREHASGLVWVKSSYSSEEGGECVEVAVCPQAVHVRDSKDIARRGLAVDAAAWTAFVGFAVR